MFGKKHIGDRLYDFLSGTLHERERAAVEDHLTKCQKCSAERRKVEKAIQVLDAHEHELPTLPEGYWDGYWKAVEVRIKISRPRSSGLEKLLEVLRGEDTRSLLSPKFAYGLLGFALGAVVMLGILSPYLSRKPQPEVAQQTAEKAEVQPATAESPTLSSVTEEISQPLIQFFQKAKAFLIAVKNTNESKETATDLVSEQETSKKLAAECRNLKRLPLDPREQQLLSELDVVLVQLSKVKNERDSLKLDLVKEGIERNNLVMRIRVHELAHEVRLLQASQAE
jgi:hypothetical protein